MERAFARRLREARARAGFSQSDLERRSGIPKSTLSRYENDHLLPSIENLLRLAHALGTTAAGLLDAEDEPAALLAAALHERGVRVGSPAEALRIVDMIAAALAEEAQRKAT